MSNKQCEFDFGQYQEPRRLLTFKVNAEPELTKRTSSQAILSTDSVERKNTPMYSGLLMYFPLALAAVARHSKRSNDKHNKGEPLHWSREKSDDHMDCIIRHATDVEHYNADIGEYEEACALAWRSLAKLQLLEEKRLGREVKS